MNYFPFTMQSTASQWREAILRPAAINISCSQLCFHPWSGNTGNITPSGRYLSPTNAVAALLPYLTESKEKDIVTLMLCAPTAGDFLGLARQFSSALPLPEIGRLCRIIVSQLSLTASKMQLPAKPATTLPPPIALSTQTTRSLSRAASIAQAGTPSELSLAALSCALKQFRQTREMALQEIASQQQALQQLSCPVWRFCSTGDIRQAAAQMQKNIPHPEWVFTAVMLFVGDDLSPLRKALHDPDDCSCA